MKKISIILLSFIFSQVFTSLEIAAQPKKQKEKVLKLAEELNEKVIKWRREIHQNPELSNREFKTAAKVAEHLESLGIEVKTKIAYTGVVGILKGGKPGPVVALRADMDALPVVERVDVPYASKVRSTYNGNDVGVMHACGHDTHVAILMGVAELLVQMKDDISGTVKFIFQPAEEGAPPEEGGGAKMMIEEGVLENPKVDAIFGLHINSQTEVGKISYKPGGTLAAADFFRIKVKGKQSHGSQPWGGVDPIVVASQIVNGLQTIVSRQVDLTNEAAVVTVGTIKGGVRHNIIPEELEMTGTIRTLDTEMQERIHEKIELTATKIAESAGAEAEVDILKGVPVTYNDPELTAKMLPILTEMAGEENVRQIPAKTGAEDFSFFQEEVPGLFFFLGGMPKGMKPEEAAPHHTPDFFIDDNGLKLGVETLSMLTLNYLYNNK
mgnify:CR=1 FL=1